MFRSVPPVRATADGESHPITPKVAQSCNSRSTETSIIAMGAGDVNTEDERVTDTSPDSNGTQPIIIEVAFPTAAVGLSEALSTDSELRVEAEKVVPTQQNPMPYLWISDGETENSLQAISNDRSVESVRLSAAVDGGRLYRIAWNTSEMALIRWISNNDAVVLHGETEAQADEWRLNLRVNSRETLEDLQQFCNDRAVRFRLIRLYKMEHAKIGRYSYTEKQQEALITALELGYFEIPREASLEEVANAMDISTGAVSERLRRGQMNLVRDTMKIGRPQTRANS